MHLELEDKIATFTSTEEAIVYSYDVATISSVIPAFAKRGDLLLIDEAANYAIQQGAMLSRSIVKYYKHNDMEDLEAVLKSIAAKDAQQPPKKLNRRFIITEGIFVVSYCLETCMSFITPYLLSAMLAMNICRIRTQEYCPT